MVGDVVLPALPIEGRVATDTLGFRPNALVGNTSRSLSLCCEAIRAPKLTPALNEVASLLTAMTSWQISHNLAPFPQGIVPHAYTP